MLGADFRDVVIDGMERFSMKTEEQIEQYIADQPQPKRDEMRDLHGRILRISPKSQLWFLDGKDSNNKIVSNPNIGYGLHRIRYANGDAKEFYRIGISANKTGISIYIFGLRNKEYLLENYGSRIGKSKITGYCIKFSSTKDLDMDVLEELIRFAFGMRDG